MTHKPDLDAMQRGRDAAAKSRAFNRLIFGTARPPAAATPKFSPTAFKAAKAKASTSTSTPFTFKKRKSAVAIAAPKPIRAVANGLATKRVAVEMPRLKVADFNQPIERGRRNVLGSNRKVRLD